MMKRIRTGLCLLLCALLMIGCTADTATLPALSLPPVAQGPEAPIGDAGLEHSTIVPLYLPSLDGQSLLTFYETLTFTRTQHPAEAILRALLAHEGNSRVQSLGGTVELTPSGDNPVEISGSVCTVNLSASALQLNHQQLYTAALAITATLCELDDISHVNVLVAGVPVSMDVGGHLPLGSLTSTLGQELPVLWEQLSARRTPLGELASATPVTATATLYFPLADGSGIAAEPRRISFPGQHPQQLVISLLEALSGGAEILHGTAEMPDMADLQLFLPEVTELQGGGRRVTIHLSSDTQRRIAEAGCDPACYFAAVTTTLTTFVPSLQQVCILLGDGALTHLDSAALGSLEFPGALLTRSAFAAALMDQTTIYAPCDENLAVHTLPLTYRSAISPRALLLAMASPAVAALPEGLTTEDLLGLAIQDDTLLINFSGRYAQVIRQSGMDQRLMAYSMVNTLCEQLNVRRVRFFFDSRALDDLGSELLWSGEFLYNPSLITH